MIWPAILIGSLIVLAMPRRDGGNHATIATSTAGTMPASAMPSTARNTIMSGSPRATPQSKVVPVWFMFDGDAIYFATGPDSYKARRIKHGSPLEVWVGSADGPHFVGKAELLRDPDLSSLQGEPEFAVILKKF